MLRFKPLVGGTIDREKMESRIIDAKSRR
jgi:hypothetical protein